MPVAQGPYSYENLRSYEAGKPTVAEYEGLIYSDCQIDGTLSLGPITLSAGLARPTAPPPRPELALRVKYTYEAPQPDPSAWRKTATGSWHGRWDDEEVAALVSLALGRRLRSGGRTRRWALDGPPEGTPFYFFHEIPYLPPVGSSGERLPGVSDAAILEDARTTLTAYASLTAKQAIALVRAARQYQDALWIANGDGELAWLKLVGALETMAGTLSQSPGTPETRIRDAMPDVWAALDGGASDEAKSVVFRTLDELARSQARFIAFGLQNLPEPPDKRPPEWACVDWSQMNSHLRQIYSWRSRALHRGDAIPLPLTEPPQYLQDLQVYEERPSGLATYTGDAQWSSEDTPMTLVMFAYVVRGAILHWLETIGRV